MEKKIEKKKCCKIKIKLSCYNFISSLERKKIKISLFKIERKNITSKQK